MFPSFSLELMCPKELQYGHNYGLDRTTTCEAFSSISSQAWPDIDEIAWNHFHLPPRLDLYGPLSCLPPATFLLRCSASIRAPARFPSDWVPTGAEIRTPWRALGYWACVFWGLLSTGCHRRYLPGLTIISFGSVGRRLVRRFVPFVFSGIGVPPTIWSQQQLARPDNDM